MPLNVFAEGWRKRKLFNINDNYATKQQMNKCSNYQLIKLCARNCNLNNASECLPQKPKENESYLILMTIMRRNNKSINVVIINLWNYVPDIAT